MKKYVLMMALTTSPSALGAPINDTLPQLPEVTVYGDRAPFLDQAQSPCILIDQAQILKSGALDLGQLLRNQGALAIRSYGPLGAMATASLRGSLGDGVLVLRDGIKLNSAENGGVDLSKISLLGIERVEVSPGGASGRYGADAVGGVINLISANRRHSRVETSFGSLGTASLQAETGTLMGNTSVAMGLSKINADNSFPYNYRGTSYSRGNAQADEFNFTAGSKSLLGRDIFETHASMSNRALGVPGPENYPSPLASQRDFQLMGVAQWSHLWDFLDLIQDTSLSHNRSTTAFSNPISHYATQTTPTLDTTDAQTKWEWTNETQRLDMGLGLSRDALSGGYDGSKERVATSLFAHEEWRPIPPWSLFSDARLDYIPAFAWNPSPRVGVSYRLNKDQQLRATVGKSFRVPSFNDLYWPTTSTASGNPTLLPETSNQYEGGWDAYFSPCKLHMTLFHNDGWNTIQWIPGLSGAWSPHNLGQTATTGLEFSVDIKLLDSLQANLSGTWLSAVDLTPGNSYNKQLMYRPNLVAHALLGYNPLKALELDLVWDYLGVRYTTSQNTDALPPIGLWSLRCLYSMTENNKLIFNLENLAASDYQLQPYYPMPGRTASLSLSHIF